MKRIVRILEGSIKKSKPAKSEDAVGSMGIDLNEFGPMMESPPEGEVPSDKVPVTKKTDTGSPPVREVDISIEIEDDGVSKESTTKKQIKFPEHEAAQDPIELKETSTAQEAFELGNEASRDANFKLARQYFEQAINMDPEFRLAYEHLAYTLENLGELQLSEKYHRIAAEREAKSLIKSPEQALRMGDNFNNQNDFERALECYNKVFSDESGATSSEIAAKACFGIGQVYMKQNKLEAAKESFEKVLKLDPENLHANKYLGYIFHKKNDLQSATIYYNKALEIDPDNQWTKEHLEQIQLHQAKQAAKSVVASSFDGIAEELAKAQRLKEAEFQQEHMGEQPVTPTEDMVCGESSIEGEFYQVPDTGQLNGIGFPDDDLGKIGVPVEPEKAPTLPPDAIAPKSEIPFDGITDDAPPPPFGTNPEIDGSVFDEIISPAVRGQDEQLLGEDVIVQKKARAKKRLQELCEVIACKEHRSIIELQGAVQGYVDLVKQDRLSCIKGVDHRAIAIALRGLWKEKIMKTFEPVYMAHSQDLSTTKEDPEEYFKALAEFGRSFFETNTTDGFEKAKKFFKDALEINPQPEDDYAWVLEFLEKIPGRIKMLKEKKQAKKAEEQPVKIEEDFEESPSTVINIDMPEEVRKEAEGGMGIFDVKTRISIPEKTKVQGKALQQRLKHQMGEGDSFDAPPTIPNHKIPEEFSEVSYSQILPPPIPIPKIENKTQSRKEAVELRRQYLETDDPAHKKMLKNIILKKHVDDIDYHQKLSTSAYLQFGISLIAFGKKEQARRALNEAMKLAKANDEKTLIDEINTCLGKLNEKAV